ncbi:hypothetical protein [Nocardioides speluncae]|uniref:hypothetical protein n=1 Tax=Nocardioides speluncae TaxID=2670337 RepID=UPI000D68CF61|nr:hypothetical protein [Nocardioides speluncae]
MSHDPGRLAAHVFLDVVCASNLEYADTPTTAAALELAFERMNEIGVVDAAVRSDGSVDVEITAVVDGAARMLGWLIDELAVRDGVRWDDVVLTIRDALDREN